MTVQPEFDFGELPKTDTQTEKPKPALPHFANPQSDNERLLNWQWEYKTAGDTDALNKMYALGRTIALKYIEKTARGKKPVARMARSDKEEKAHNAITYIIARYLHVKDFAIQESFTAYLYLRIKHELFYTRKVDKIVQFVDMETFRGAK